VNFVPWNLIICILHYILSVTYNNLGLKVEDNVKFLGMYVDRHLNRKQHYEKLREKLNTMCFMQRTLQFVVSEQVLRMVYFSQFQSQLEYGVIFWGSSPTMKNIFGAQNRAVRVMLRLSPRSTCKEGFKRMCILTVHCLYICYGDVCH
jgi:hypothetical protein